ncbi:MAG TPA: AbrB/MazE/SpoVT family DNA-binding domain-containing protein [Euryarchaeota archaeon]|nr:AbrB/MazE/SpoVT family DNA-binding domain-containing protein [Euryarchaeota archaeon]
MSEVFKAKVRKIGNAFGVIIPKEILKSFQVSEGEEVQLIMPIARPKRLRAIEEAAGRYMGAASFTREREDRF